MRSIRRFRSRALVAMLVTVTLAVSLSVAPVAANVPVQHVEGIGCVTNPQGNVNVLWHPPSLAPGVVVFKADAPATVTGTDGLEPEVSLGGQAYTRVFGGSNSVFYTVHVAGPPSSPCEVNLAFTEQPTNTTVASAEALSGRIGSTDGTTRAATVAGGATAPLPDAQTAVWYRWHGGDGPIDFTAIPHHTGGVFDDSDPFTSVGVAVFDVTDPSTPLAVGGDGIANPSGGTGGTASLQVNSTSEYLVAVFSAGGTGNQLSNFGYTAAGAFTLSWNGPNSPPVAGADDVATPDNTPAYFNVLGNDSDPDGDPITFAVHPDAAHARHAPGHRRRRHLPLHAGCRVPRHGHLRLRRGRRLRRARHRHGHHRRRRHAGPTAERQLRQRATDQRRRLGVRDDRLGHARDRRAAAPRRSRAAEHGLGVVLVRPPRRRVHRPSSANTTGEWQQPEPVRARLHVHGGPRDRDPDRRPTD